MCVDILDDVVRLGVGIVQASIQVKGHIQKVHYLMIAINFNPEAIVAKKFTQRRPGRVPKSTRNRANESPTLL